MTKETKLIGAALLGALVLVGGSYLFRSRGTEPDGAFGRSQVARITARVQPTKPPPLGAPNSEHSHASLIVFLEDDIFDFAQARYMLRDERAHFENNDGLTLHKHATGATLTYFFSTLGIELTPTCFELDTGARYCADANKKLRLFVNGEELSTFDTYEVHEWDKILLDYSADTDARLRLKMNHVPEVPKEFKKLF